MQIHESAENYLETILILQKRNGRVRAVVSIVTEESIGLTREWDSDRTTE